MLIKYLGTLSVVCMVGLMALPAQANPVENCAAYSESLALQRAIDGLQSQGNNFFDVGQERFEQEIEQLIQEQTVAEPPLLTIDESALLKPEELEHPE